MSSVRNIDDLFNSDSDDTVVIDECITEQPVPADVLPVPTASKTTESSDDVDPTAPTEVIRIVRKTKDKTALKQTKTKTKTDEKKDDQPATPGWRGALKQSPRCAARCDIVKQEIDALMASGKLFTSRDLMDIANGRYNYADVMVVTKSMKAAGLIHEALKGRAGIWQAPPAKPEVGAA
jgi:hypothetical protein